MPLQNEEVYIKFKETLKKLRYQDEEVHGLVTELMNDVFKEFNTNKDQHIEKLLKERIETIAKLKLGIKV